MRIALLNGPNLNLLGEREPTLYGNKSLRQIENMVRLRASQRGASVEAFQSNHEGELIDRLHAERHRANGILFNPGAYTHTSYALRDAIAAIRPPVAEVHLTDLEAREEPWRRVSVIRDVCAFHVMGKGAMSYLLALDRLLDRLGVPQYWGPAPAG
ncbi:MAG: type II 3-dehydroquinate dehydratase [Planctomycetota bacterium]